MKIPENGKKPLNNMNLHYVFSQYLGTSTIFLKTRFFDRLVFSLLIELNLREVLLIFFCKLTYFLRNFSTVFVDISLSFQYVLKRISALKFQLTATEYYAFDSVPSVESIKLIGDY